MFYYTIKTIHILSAACLFAGVLNAFIYWLRTRNHLTNATNSTLQKITWFLIIPSALIQLFTGFTIISFKHYPVTALWVKVAALGFIIVILAWFACLYLQIRYQAIAANSSHKSHSRRYYAYSLWVSYTVLLVSICIMIFFMANKIS